MRVCLKNWVIYCNCVSRTNVKFIVIMFLVSLDQKYWTSSKYELVHCSRGEVSKLFCTRHQQYIHFRPEFILFWARSIVSLWQEWIGLVTRSKFQCTLVVIRCTITTTNWLIISITLFRAFTLAIDESNRCNFAITLNILASKSFQVMNPFQKNLESCFSRLPRILIFHVLSELSSRAPLGSIKQFTC